MRLINTATLQLDEFVGEIPEYAIVSHTWGDREVTFQEFYTPEGRQEPSYAKIQLSARQARADGFKYVWIDTCCIDKTSSAELSEAINSMMVWYEKSQVCYAYLADVPATFSKDAQEAAFRRSKWFTRGWTLQELIAPPQLVFFDCAWNAMYTRHHKASLVSQITQIDHTFLVDFQYRLPAGVPAHEYSLRSALDLASVAQRMSWMSRRQTTRIEDMAYCLLGVFGINMPLIYGEGTRAFLRLQEEIMKYSDDHSLFAWNPPPVDDVTPVRDPSRQYVGLLATSPAHFSDCHDIIRITGNLKATPHFYLTNKGIRLKLPFDKPGKWTGPRVLLQCQDRKMPSRILAVGLRKGPGDVYAREYFPLNSVDISMWRRWHPESIYALAWGSSPTMAPDRPCTVILRNIDPSLRILGISSSEGNWKPGSHVVPEPAFKWKQPCIKVAVLLGTKHDAKLVLLLVVHGRLAYGLGRLSGKPRDNEDTWARIKLNCVRLFLDNPSRMVTRWWQSSGNIHERIKDSVHAGQVDHAVTKSYPSAYTSSVKLDYHLGQRLVSIDIKPSPTALDRFANIDGELLDRIRETLFRAFPGRLAHDPYDLIHYYAWAFFVFNGLMTRFAIAFCMGGLVSVLIFCLLTAIAIFDDFFKFPDTPRAQVHRIDTGSSDRRPRLLKYMLYYCIWIFAQLVFSQAWRKFRDEY
ncbi:heterokaryon incompatibility protein-domain-containing protein [Cladorrhinum sp. PSN332]|nr:heterokaryon incompatibility protein-domain-containing protein [Cladorrhinum sp. PSN332]